MHRISLLAIVVISFLGARVSGQDVLTLGSEIASAGGVASIPVSILDRSGTPLGTDVSSGNRIQGFAFKVLFPTELVTSIAFTRAGIAASITPMHATALQGSGWSSCIVSFNESSNPIAFNLNTTAPGDRIGTLTVTMRGDAPIGSVATLILDPPSAMLSNQTSTTRETVASGNLSLVNGSVTVSAVQAPTNLVATASGTSQVNVTWTGFAGADHYEVWRSFNGGAYTLVGSPAAAAFTDSSVSANTTYLYRVRAIDGANPSGYSNFDLATTIVFTDDPVVATSTIVKAAHLTQLRTAVNAVRTSAGLAALGSDPTIGPGLAIRAQHITTLRTALNEARTVIGVAALSFTDTPPVIVKAVHVQELRNGVK